MSPWTAIDARKTALLIVDLQNCFVENSPAAGAEARDVITRLNTLAAACRARDIPVIYTVHVVREDHADVGLLADLIPYVVGRGEPGLLDDGSHPAAMHADVDVQPGDIVLKKPRFGAFVGTELAIILRSLGADTVIIGGISTEICAETTARQAAEMDLKVLFLKDGTTTCDLPDGGLGPATAEEIQRVTCAIIARAFGKVLSVDDALEMVAASGPGAVASAPA
jgi:ureidoacrylate peracid hydrolase